MTSGEGFVLLSAQKPPHMEPCNGCGFCCQNEACQLSIEYLKSSVAPCVALEWCPSEGVYRCGLVANPGKYLATPAFGDDILGGIFAESLGIGKGCDAD